MNTRSIRFRLSAWHAVLFAGVFALLGALLYAKVKNYLDDALLETQARRARQIAETLLANPAATGEEYVVRQIRSLYAPELGNRFIRVTRADGSVMYVSGPPDDQSFDPSKVPAASQRREAEFTRQESLADGRSMLIAAFRAASAGGGPYLVEVGTSSEPVDRFARHLLVLLALGYPLVVALAGVGGYIVARNALRPVETIAVKAEIITLHNLSERLPVANTGDELERLSIALNHMITRLDEALGNSRRFVADASHELRTPLTVIQGELEAIASEENLAADIRDRVGSILEEVERLGKIVQKLFALSRLDAGEAQEEWVRLDLAELVASTAEQMLLLAEDKRIGLAPPSGKAVHVMGDRARLKQVVVNLVDNAVKYTPPGGSIQLRVEAEGPNAMFEVADTGVGIPVADIPHVFERFFRVDRDRSSNIDGAGLGLSIVKSICTAHGGQVDVESAVGSGSRFRVTLPLAGSN
ncbi:MAG TPA: ATP-binding protein [Opitutaceae bacterium]|jgi:heavy metal sensor kinase|nr:ATP-binding protein [Opitutaceae bacterium]